MSKPLRVLKSVGRSRGEGRAKVIGAEKEVQVFTRCDLEKNLPRHVWIVAKKKKLIIYLNDSTNLLLLLPCCYQSNGSRAQFCISTGFLFFFFAFCHLLVHTGRISGWRRRKKSRIRFYGSCPSTRASKMQKITKLFMKGDNYWPEKSLLISVELSREFLTRWAIYRVICLIRNYPALAGRVRCWLHVQFWKGNNFNWIKSLGNA